MLVYLVPDKVIVQVIYDDTSKVPFDALAVEIPFWHAFNSLDNLKAILGVIIYSTKW